MHKSRCTKGSLLQDLQVRLCFAAGSLSWSYRERERERHADAHAINASVRMVREKNDRSSRQGRFKHLQISSSHFNSSHSESFPNSYISNLSGESNFLSPWMVGLLQLLHLRKFLRASHWTVGKLLHL